MDRKITSKRSSEKLKTEKDVHSLKPVGKGDQKITPPVPKNETERVALLHSLNILDTQPEQAFDDIVTLAAAICNTPIALITLVDENRQWFKANIGLNVDETPREISFCAHAILNPDDVTVIADAQKDPRFKTNPLVTSDPNIRFYAGAPLVTHDGFSLGTLCVIDRKPRRLTPDQLAALRALRHSVITEFELRRALMERKELQATAGSDKHLRELIEDAIDRVRDGFVAFDLQMNYTYVNQSGGELLGRKPEDLIGKNYWKEYPEGKGTPFAEACVRALKTQAPIQFDDYYEPLDRWVKNRIYPSKEGLSVFFHDITERKRAEDALKASEKRFRALIENGWDAVTLADAQGTIIYASPSTIRVLGYTPDEYVGVNAFTLFHPDDLALARDKLMEVLQAPGNVVTTQVRMLHKDGSWRWMEGVITNLLDEPDVQALVTNYHDITERKQAEEALRQSEERFRILIENSWDAVALFGADGQILYGSPSTVQILGYSLNEFVGRNAFDLIHHEDQAFVAERLKISLEQPGEHVSIYARVRHKNGEWRWLEGVFTNLLGEVSVQAVVNNYHDFTERKQAESLQDAIYQISEAAGRSSNLDELFQAVHAIIGQVMSAHNFYIALYDDESDLISFPYYVDEMDRFTSASISAAKPGRGMTEYVMRTGKPLLSDIANFEELAERGEVELIGPPSPIWIGAPLIVDGRTIGAMAMQDYADANVYTERELRMLEYVSGQVAKAIERTRLYEDIQRHNHILSGLQEATLPLIRQRELSEVLQAIMAQASQLLNTSHGYIYLVEPDEKTIHVVLETGVFSGDIGLKLRQGEGLAGKVWQTAQPLNVRDYHTWPGRFAHFDKIEFHAVVGVPLMSGSRVIGVLGLAYLESERTFSNEDVELLSRFAQLASIAFENARLYTRVRQELAERQMAQTALREAEATYRSLIERLPVVVYNSELGTAGAWHYVSPQIESLLGFTPAEWIADPELWYRQVHPDDRERQEALEQQAYVRGEPFEGEYRIFTRAGREIWIRDSAQILLPPEGQLPIVQGVLVDITERKQAEEALHESEETTRLIIDTALDAVITIDQDGQITRWNDQAETIFGWTRAEAVGQRLSKLIIPPDLRAAHERGLKHYLETGEGPVLDKRIEITAQGRNGNIFPVELTIHVLKANNKVSFAAFVRDITERKQAEDALQQSEQAYANLLKNITGAIYRCHNDKDWTVEYISEGCTALTGYRPEEIIESRVTSLGALMHPEDVVPIWEKCQVNLAARKECDNEYRIFHRNSGMRWVRDQAQGVYSDEGQLIYIEGLITDITDQKRADQDLRAAEGRYRTLVEQLPIIVYVNPASDIGSTTYVSPQVKPFLGFTQEEWLEDPKSWSKTLHPEDRQRILAEVKRVDQSGEPFDAEYRLVARDGHVVWIRDKATLLRDANDLPLLWQGLMIDITQRKQAEDQIKRQVDHLKALRMIDRTITASADLHLSLQAILKQAISHLQADAADVLLLNPTTHLLEYSDGVGFFTRGVERSSVRIGEGLAGRAVLERKMVSIHALYESKESLTRKTLLDGENFTDYYGVPLIAKGEVKGVLEVFQRARIEADQEWEDFLESLAGQAGLAIDNATLFQNLQRSNLELGMAYESTLEGWSAALDLRDKETEGHTLRVTNLTLRLAKHMGLNDKDLMQIRRGALLHDIGKMGVPDRILLKPDNLTTEEWEIMQRHPVYAYELLSRIEYLRPALSIPYCHHEKWNGTGYPRGLKGEEIPLEARVFSVVDVYDALVSDRPYRPAWTKEKALEYIRSLSGVDFDPRVVAGFLELLNQN